MPKTAIAGFGQTTLDSGINVGVRLLIFGLFSSGYVLIKGGTFINFLIFNFFTFFDIFFFTFFPSAMYKKIKLGVVHKLRGPIFVLF